RRAHGGSGGGVDVENGTLGVGHEVGGGRADGAHLRDQFAHLFRAAAGYGLVGHGRDPLDVVAFEQAAQGHEHQAYGTVAAVEFLLPLVEPPLDDSCIDRVEDDHRVLVHAQRGGGVDPVAFPAGRAQSAVNIGGVVAALAGDDDVHGGQRVDVV